MTIKTREREKRTLTTIKDKHKDPRREYRIRKTRGEGWDRKTCFKDQRLNIEWTEQEKSLYTHIIQFIYLYDDKKLAHVSVNTSIYDDRGFIAP